MQVLPQGRKLNPEEFDFVCRQFVEIFPKSTIFQAYESFTWGAAKSAAQARAERDNAASAFSSWVKAGCPQETAILNIEIVHKWGFGGQGLNKRQRVLFEPKYLESFRSLMKAWLVSDNANEMHRTLATCLNTPYIKIARFSKWICFIDQERFAIYDSRVSLALRKIELDGKRVFPTLGAKSQGRPNADFISSNACSRARKMADSYLIYIDVLRAVCTTYDLPSVASIEMALFMLGLDQRYW